MIQQITSNRLRPIQLTKSSLADGYISRTLSLRVNLFFGLTIQKGRFEDETAKLMSSIAFFRTLKLSVMVLICTFFFAATFFLSSTNFSNPFFESRQIALYACFHSSPLKSLELFRSLARYRVYSDRFVF